MENDVLYNRIMKKVAEMIAEAGGGSSLPEVTADDNGDVLTVVSGAWAKAEPAPQYDLIFKYEEDNQASLVLVSGSYQNCVPKILALQPVTALLYVWHRDQEGDVIEIMYSYQQLGSISYSTEFETINIDMGGGGYIILDNTNNPFFD